MASYQCCVGGCDSTSNTHRLFCMPVNENLHNLWMSFLVPTNPILLGLNKNQLLKKRVCAKHFDQTQFDSVGVRIRNSYPCLFTELEIAHSVPLTYDEYSVDKEHNYCRVQEQIDDNSQSELAVLASMQGAISFNDHPYSLPSTSHTSVNAELQSVGQSIQQFNVKTRQYIKKCKKVGKDSLGDTNMQRLHSAQKLAENFAFMSDFDKLSKRAKEFLMMQLRLASKKKNGSKILIG
ncbi:hypothetical protein ACJJTC_015251 [Scirpophaga incertulas]